MAEVKNLKLQPRSRASGMNRRASTRWSPAAVPSLKGAELCDGPEVRLINISRGGALFETEARMLPDADICMRLIATDATFLIRGRVVRSRASAMRGSVIVYESAVTFDTDFPLPVAGEVPCQREEGLPASPVDGSAPGGLEISGATAGEQKPATYSVTAFVSRSGPDLQQIFGLNTW